MTGDQVECKRLKMDELSPEERTNRENKQKEGTEGLAHWQRFYQLMIEGDEFLSLMMIKMFSAGGALLEEVFTSAAISMQPASSWNSGCLTLHVTAVALGMCM